MTKEQLLEKFEKEIGTQTDYFNHRGGLMNEVFEWFYSKMEQEIAELNDQLKAADALLEQAVKEWSIGDHYDRCVNFKSALEKYNSLKSKTT